MAYDDVDYGALMCQWRREQTFSWWEHMNSLSCAGKWINKTEQEREAIGFFFSEALQTESIISSLSLCCIEDWRLREKI